MFCWKEDDSKITNDMLANDGIHVMTGSGNLTAIRICARAASATRPRQNNKTEKLSVRLTLM